MDTIILLHGALGSASSMLPLKNALNMDVRALDFPGHGNAKWPEDGLSIESLEETVVRFIRENELAPVHIFGYSLGGFIGLRIAEKRPELIKTITTLATKFDWDEESCERESRMLDADVIGQKVPKFAASLSNIHIRNSWKQVMNATQKMISNMYHYRFDKVALSAMQTPACIMVGDRDKMVGFNETIEVWQSLPDATLAILPGTQHPLDQIDCDLLAAMIHRRISTL